MMCLVPCAGISRNPRLRGCLKSKDFIPLKPAGGNPMGTCAVEHRAGVTGDCTERGHAEPGGRLLATWRGGGR